MFPIFNHFEPACKVLEITYSAIDFLGFAFTLGAFAKDTQAAKIEAAMKKPDQHCQELAGLLGTLPSH